MEMNQTILGLIALFSVGISVFLGAVILGTFEQQTSGQCTFANTTEANSTLLNVTVGLNQAAARSHGFTLASYMQSTTQEQVPIAVVTYLQGNQSCNVTYNDGTWIANLDGTSPDTVTFSKTQAPANIYTVKYTECGTSNVTKTNMTYYVMSSCSYTENAYNTISQVNKNVTGVMSIASILPYIMVIVVVLGAFGAFLYMRKD